MKLRITVHFIEIGIHFQQPLRTSKKDVIKRASHYIRMVVMKVLNDENKFILMWLLSITHFVVDKLLLSTSVKKGESISNWVIVNQEQ